MGFLSRILQGGLSISPGNWKTWNAPIRNAIKNKSTFELVVIIVPLCSTSYYVQSNGRMPWTDPGVHKLIAKLSPAQCHLSFSFAGLRLALFPLNPSPTPRFDQEIMYGV